MLLQNEVLNQDNVNVQSLIGSVKPVGMSFCYFFFKTQVFVSEAFGHIWQDDRLCYRMPDVPRSNHTRETADVLFPYWEMIVFLNTPIYFRRQLFRGIWVSSLFSANAQQIEKTRAYYVELP